MARILHTAVVCRLLKHSLTAASESSRTQFPRGTFDVSSRMRVTCRLRSASTSYFD